MCNYGEKVVKHLKGMTVKPGSFFKKSLFDESKIIVCVKILYKLSFVHFYPENFNSCHDAYTKDYFGLMHEEKKRKSSLEYAEQFSVILVKLC